MRTIPNQGQTHQKYMITEDFARIHLRTFQPWTTPSLHQVHSYNITSLLDLCWWQSRMSTVSVCLWFAHKNLQVFTNIHTHRKSPYITFTKAQRVLSFFKATQLSSHGTDSVNFLVFCSFRWNRCRLSWRQKGLQTSATRTPKIFWRDR